MTATAAPVKTAPDVVTLARRASRLFLGSFVAFVGIVVASSILDGDRDAAQRTAAAELDVNINHLPPEVLAQIIRDAGHPAVPVITAILAILSTALLATAVWNLCGVAGQRRHPLVRAAVGLAVFGGTAFTAMIGSELLLAREPAWLVGNWWLYLGLVTVFVLAVCLSLALVVLRQWPTGLARRTSVVVLVLLALTAVAMVTAGAPPIVPMLLGAVFAFNVKRAVAKA